MGELDVKGIILPEISRSANGSYVIANGQLVVDADTGDLYKGDGVTTFSNLTAIGGIDFTEDIEKINSVNVGSDNSNSGTNAIAIGFGNSANYNYDIAIGYNATASANYSIAIGYGASASNQYDICLGNQTKGASNKGIYLNNGLVSETIEIPEITVATSSDIIQAVDDICSEILGV